MQMPLIFSSIAKVWNNVLSLPVVCSGMMHKVEADNRVETIRYTIDDDMGFLADVYRQHKNVATGKKNLHRTAFFLRVILT